MHVDLPNVEGSSAVMYKQAVENLSQERAVLDTLKNAAEKEHKKLLTDEDELATLRPMEADERQRLERGSSESSQSKRDTSRERRGREASQRKRSRDAAEKQETHKTPSESGWGSWP